MALLVSYKNLRKNKLTVNDPVSKVKIIDTILFFMLSKLLVLQFRQQSLHHDLDSPSHLQASSPVPADSFHFFILI